MTIHKLTAGSGYTYLTRQVAGGDVERARGQGAADYYTAKGNPPGAWGGRGADLLGLAGSQVSEAQMRALYGEGRHPNAEVIVREFLARHAEPGMSKRARACVEDAAIRASRLGRPFPVYETLAPFADRVARRLAAVHEEAGREPTQAERKGIQRAEAKRQRAAVAGFDVVFAPVKSAALLWALDERPWVRAAVRAAHEEARDAALAMLEQHAAFTRVGNRGEGQIDTDGLTYARFDHYDSRAGEPNLHTHVAIANKVRGTDGKWRALDARALYRMTVAASEFYNTAFETALRTRVRVRFASRPGSARGVEPVREIVGVPTDFLTHFSSRRTEIEARYDQLLRDYHRDHGHDPPKAMCHRLARQATIETREGKKPARSLEEMRADWRRSLSDAFGSDAVPALGSAVSELEAEDSQVTAPRVPPREMVEELAGWVVAAVSEQRSMWTVWNLRAEAERLARERLRFTSLAEHQMVVEAITAEATRLSVRVEPPELVSEPEALRRRDGESIFTEHAAARYTSRIVLDAEDRLLAAAQASTGRAIPETVIAATLTSQVDDALAPDQRALVAAFAGDDRQVVVGIGPAGAGKTTAMRALARVAQAAGRRMVPLATSAAAATVLGNELGLVAENLHKFVYEHTIGTHAAALAAGQPVPDHLAALSLRAGDIVLLDEAGMAGTFNLDRLVTIAQRHGALVRLLGDDRQLGAVESGGALRLIATDVGAARLETLYRFCDAAEGEATLQLREGESHALAFYTERDRVHGGSRQAMIDLAYAGWRADMLAGKTSLMAAATTTTVTELSARARADRVAAQQVEQAGTPLHDGNQAGRGDWITTRHNDRRLTVLGGKDWVKNGDAWHVTTRHGDGSLTARHLVHGGIIHLPAGYVARHVELLYATTTHRAQGSTVDTAHPVISEEMSRENLYVIATRARQRTNLYVITHQLMPLDSDDQLDATRHDPDAYAAIEVLENVLGRESTELSATQTIRDAQNQAVSLATLIPPYLHALQADATIRHTNAIHTVIGQNANQILDDRAWPAVHTALREAERHGWEPQAVLARALQRGPINHADSPAQLLAWRLADYTHQRGPTATDHHDLPPWIDAPRPAHSDSHNPSDWDTYLNQRADLIKHRVKHLTDAAGTDRPAWTKAFGNAPPNPQEHATWLHHLGTAAAYRDQHHITDNNPDHPIGPYIERGHAGHDAYQHAARAILTAHLITNTPTGARNLQSIQNLAHQLGIHLEITPQPDDTSVPTRRPATNRHAHQHRRQPSQTRTMRGPRL